MEGVRRDVVQLFLFFFFFCIFLKFRRRKLVGGGIGIIWWTHKEEKIRIINGNGSGEWRRKKIYQKNIRSFGNVDVNDEIVRGLLSLNNRAAYKLPSPSRCVHNA